MATNITAAIQTELLKNDPKFRRLSKKLVAVISRREKLQAKKSKAEKELSSVKVLFQTVDNEEKKTQALVDSYWKKQLAMAVPSLSAQFGGGGFGAKSVLEYDPESDGTRRSTNDCSRPSRNQITLCLFVAKKLNETPQELANSKLWEKVLRESGISAADICRLAVEAGFAKHWSKSGNQAGFSTGCRYLERHGKLRRIGDYGAVYRYIGKLPKKGR